MTRNTARKLTTLLVALVIWPIVGCTANGDKPISRIAFGSCLKQDKPAPIWDEIADTKPDVFLFIGDNIYADTEDMSVMRAGYDTLNADAGYQRLKRSCPILAVWDDHDFGVNDGGAEYPMRDASQKEFLRAFDEPADSPRRRRPGIYIATTVGPPGQRVQLILLDTRYFRGPLAKAPDSQRAFRKYIPNLDKSVTMLGERQWEWLQQQLRKPADLRIIASSIQVVPEDHGWEKWSNLPHERRRLFDLIEETKADGVLFVSGDRHIGELSMMDAGFGYPAYDLTSSGLNSASSYWRTYEPNSHRVGTMNWGDNFGLIDIDWSQADPEIRLQIRDVEGDINIQRKIRLSTITTSTDAS